MWDIANVAFVIEPTWLPARRIHAPRIGADLRWRRRATRRHTTEVVDVNRDAIFGDFFSRLRTAFAPHVAHG